ncbi:NADH-quinone oxidoreductase subunit L [Leeia oryzae]|uniref:NADH-quinone oxidoreductase subunit L n=1 Tax=Leeia oryzae TaxID=356662 RepID=UPI00036DE95A|nr:NADH-quinone oxidoreductase subunit L [Leeia oryzae]
MNPVYYAAHAVALAPAVLMFSYIVLRMCRPGVDTAVWAPFRVLAGLGLMCALVQPCLLWSAKGLMPASEVAGWGAWFAPNPLSAWLAVLVQLLGTVIGVFSARYLQGEPGQHRYAIAFAGVLGSVHPLLLAGHWLVLITAWAAVGLFLRHLLCFYQDRPFALLAAHKKRIADRLADMLMLLAAVLAWSTVGSGSFAGLWAYLAQHGAPVALQGSAICLMLAVILRTALFPFHGWLIQVMEAPTPVSAMLHAGVVNLGGYLLIRFSPLLAVVSAARWLLVAFGLGTALLAGFVMLTRISIKVRLAWSTVAQMGFMVLECGLGMYELAALHLIGHSLYKAHAFLSASSVVRNTRLQMMRGQQPVAVWSLLLAPVVSLAIVTLVQMLAPAGWPWWWSGILALAWSPLLWAPAAQDGVVTVVWRRVMFGALMVAVLTTMAALVHMLPLRIADAPFHAAGWVALAGMALLYLGLATLHLYPQGFLAWRRWSYAGFYVDEFYTRLALRLWPARWTPEPASHTPPPLAGTMPVMTKD